MSNSTIFREKKDEAFKAYIGGKTDPKEIALLVGCSHVTVQKWIKQGKWDKLQSEDRKLDRRIAVARRKALLTALEEYASDPKSTALQSLVSILRSEMKKDGDTKEINEYIVTFLDQTTDFFLERGLNGLLKDFQAVLADLAEYLRKRNS